MCPMALALRISCLEHTSTSLLLSSSSHPLTLTFSHSHTLPNRTRNVPLFLAFFWLFFLFCTHHSPMISICRWPEEVIGVDCVVITLSILSYQTMDILISPPLSLSLPPPYPTHTHIPTTAIVWAIYWLTLHCTRPTLDTREATAGVGIPFIFAFASSTTLKIGRRATIYPRDGIRVSYIWIWSDDWNLFAHRCLLLQVALDCSADLAICIRFGTREGRHEKKNHDHIPF